MRGLEMLKPQNIDGRGATVFLLSLLLAFSIWLLHNLSLSYTVLVKVPVTASCNIDGHASESSNPAMVMARCRTRGFDIIRMNRLSRRKPVRVEFSAEEMHRKGGETFYVTSSDLNRHVQAIFGDKAGMESFVSDTLFFRFPYQNNKKVPVKPVYSMSMKSQYMAVGGLRIIPDSVIVYGEPSHLENIGRVLTKTFSLYELDSPVSGAVALEKIRGVRLSQEEVSYSVDVERYVEIRETVHIGTRNVPKGQNLVVYPAMAVLTMHCAFPVNGNPSGKMSFYIDYEDFMESLSGKCIPSSNGLPDGVLGYSLEPEVFDCVASSR